jgi:CheY-like chemotaxis protein
MPDIDGLALAAKIRQRTELSATRIILLTAGDLPGDLARTRQLGITAKLLKALQKSELKAPPSLAQLETIAGELLQKVDGLSIENLHQEALDEADPTVGP